jgi:hypothetical protein
VFVSIELRGEKNFEFRVTELQPYPATPCPKAEERKQ